MSQPTKATRRDGVELSEGDTVTCDIHTDCSGCLFIIDKITPYNACESGHMVLIKFEHECSKHLNGRTGLGLDANWFKLHAAAPATIPESPGGPGPHIESIAPAPVDAGRAEPIEDSPPTVLPDRKRRGGRKLGGGADQQLGLEL